MKYLIRIVENINSFNNHHSSLKNAMQDFIKLIGNIPYALIGGLALGFRARPRGTQDIDILLNSEDDLHKVINLLKNEFKKHRTHAVEHKSTGVEIELLTPEFLNINPQIVEKIILLTTLEDGIKVADVGGLTASKLLRGSRRDQGDIEDIIKQVGQVDLSEFDLPTKAIELYKEIEKEIL